MITQFFASKARRWLASTLLAGVTFAGTLGVSTVASADERVEARHDEGRFEHGRRHEEGRGESRQHRGQGRRGGERGHRGHGRRGHRR